MKRSPLKRSLVPMKRTASLKRTITLKRSRGKRRVAQAPITSMARGEPCLIRIPGTCNGDPATTVPCHFRLSGLSGAGYIPDALYVAWGCSACHTYCDSNHDDETQLAFAYGVFRTQARLKELGVLVIGRAA